MEQEKTYKTVVERLHEIEDNHRSSEEDFKEFVGQLSEEDWRDLVKCLPKNPRLGWLDDLRTAYFQEHGINK